MAIDSMLQRRVMGRFATGVTLLTTRFDEGILGMTANAVMSLSLEPPLIVVAVDKKNSMHECLIQGRCFALNMLRADQEAISRRFAISGPKDFSGLSLTKAETGAPILVDAIAFVDCKLVDVLPAGDHDMFVGEPVAGEERDGEPLLFYSGEYR
ncbi:MAG: flavin reductase family protein [Candidatus Poribacteria bacterium]|nr:flavin reductase family protein [Candidatus Poribacteria bacterium]MDE0506388.1 flavin reductase family protein [Candidatus Poribacteria bacterium]